MNYETIHPAGLSEEALLRACEVTRTRRQGPGGQHRNKVETAIVLVHGPTGVKSEASERRSQHENQRVALHRLRVNLALAVRGECEAEESQTRAPSNLWRGRTTGGRIVVSPTHDDFAPLLAEALDAIARHNYDLAAAAAALGVSSSQLVKLLRVEPRGLKQVNDRRIELGLKALR